MFKEGSNFCLPPSNSNKSVHYVTLTSTALEALEKAAQSKERATIQFIQDEGLIVLPQSQRYEVLIKGETWLHKPFH